MGVSRWFNSTFSRRSHLASSRWAFHFSSRAGKGIIDPMSFLSDDNKITYFAQTDSRNKRTPFGIKTPDRSKHMYVIGKTGMGKSTMLENMAIQDIKNGHGLAFIDPHGKTAELLLDYVPAERVRDVLYFAPFDSDFPVSFNVMEDVGPDKRHLVSNGLMSAFKKIWVDVWSARMEYILNNILLALLEYPDSTLLGVNRMLADKEYRKKVVDNITDVSVKAFWTDEFARYGDRYMQEAGAAIQNKIGQFISNPLVRNIIGQPKSTFDIRKMMDERKILIMNLSKGRVGEANANLLGSMLITKVYLSAMSRADTPEKQLRVLPAFYLYVDEFQSFANESFADILSEARKYKLNLIIAHQYIEQMSEEVRAAVFGNVGTMAVFRVGAFDAEVLEKEFAPQFTAQDLVNLGRFQCYLKLMIDEVTSQPFSATTLPPIQADGPSYHDAIISLSRNVFAHPRDTVESQIRDWHAEQTAPPADRTDRRPPRPSASPLTVSTPTLTPSRPPQTQVPVVQERRTSPVPPSVDKDHRAREAEMQKAVSISYQKQQEERKNRPPRMERPQNQSPRPQAGAPSVNTLRKALEEALKNREEAWGKSSEQGKDVSFEKPIEVKPVEARINSAPQTSPPPEKKEVEKKPAPEIKPTRSEVPEEVLKKVLDSDHAEADR